MIINADEFASGKIKTHYCIVGSGIAGGTLANDLAEKKQDFYLIEAGDLTGNSKLVPTKSTGLPFRLSATTSIELGGTSNLWHGVLGMLDPIDFEKREWIPHSGWPISFAELLPFYQKAATLFRVENDQFFFPAELDALLQQKLLEISFNREIAENKLFQQPLPPLRFKNLVRRITRDSAHYHCMYNAIALELEMGDDATITQLVVKNRKKETIVIEAEVFILAAGALQTPRILLNSKGFHGGGIGNQHNLIGKFLMDHPMGNLVQLAFKKRQHAHLYSDMKYAPNCKIKTGLTFKAEVQEQFQLPNHNFYMRPSFVRGINDESEKIKLALLTFLDRDKRIGVKEVLKVAGNFNVVMQILAYKFSLNVKYRYADLFFVTEQIPNPQSTVSLSPELDPFGYPVAEVHWSLTEDDLTSVKKIYWLLKDKVFSSRDFEFVHGFEELQWERIFTSGAHHVGTARMASTSKDGVVDKNLKVFGTKNLYVADGSVFPTSGNVNSGFTISAIASRLADHLAKKK